MLPLAVFPVPYLVVFGSIVGWVYLDASARDSRVPAAWAVVSAFGGLVLPYYFLSYRRRHGRTRPRTTAERSLGIVALGGTLAFVATSFLVPPDPSTQGRVLSVTVPAFVVGVLLVGRARDRWDLGPDRG